MTVLTLNQEDFHGACERLASQVHLTGFSPDLLVGIASGGLIVAHAVARSTFFRDIRICEVSCQRKSTHLKNRFKLALFARKIPGKLNDFLRILESRAARYFSDGSRSHRTVSYAVGSDAVMKGARRILIVDDAVDSGSTLFSVIEAIRLINDHAEIRSAAITVTWEKPMVKPNYFIHSGVLVRFPWSADAS